MNDNICKRHCKKCKRTVSFECSGKFRVNANGKLVDVWLIYRCERCGASWNREIYSRVKPSSIDKALYQGFIENDSETVALYAGKKNTEDID